MKDLKISMVEAENGKWSMVDPIEDVMNHFTDKVTSVKLNKTLQLNSGLCEYRLIVVKNNKRIADKDVYLNPTLIGDVKCLARGIEKTLAATEVKKVDINEVERLLSL